MADIVAVYAAGGLLTARTGSRCLKTVGLDPQFVFNRADDVDLKIRQFKCYIFDGMVTLRLLLIRKV
jgi:hypothetical protein